MSTKEQRTKIRICFVGDSIAVDLYNYIRSNCKFSNFVFSLVAANGTKTEEIPRLPSFKNMIEKPPNYVLLSCGKNDQNEILTTPQNILAILDILRTKCGNPPVLYMALATSSKCTSSLALAAKEYMRVRYSATTDKVSRRAQKVHAGDACCNDCPMISMGVWQYSSDIAATWEPLRSPLKIVLRAGGVALEKRAQQQNFDDYFDERGDHLGESGLNMCAESLRSILNVAMIMHVEKEHTFTFLSDLVLRSCKTRVSDEQKREEGKGCSRCRFSRKGCSRCRSTANERKCRMQAGMRVTALDRFDGWHEAVVKHVHADGQCLIHYHGWNKRYDEWIHADSKKLKRRKI